LEKGSNRLPREVDDGGTEDYLNVPPMDITTTLLEEPLYNYLES